MTGKSHADLAQSVKQRLLNLRTERVETFNRLLNRYAAERFLFRLAETSHGARYILKGALLVSLWSDQPYRSTMDVDLLGPIDTSQDQLHSTIGEACRIDVEPDGMRFDATSIQIAEIREGQVYQGLRVKLMAYLDVAKIPIQIDVGFGDAVTPAPVEILVTPLLDMPGPLLMAYPPETVIAEKLEAVVSRGQANSRMKDFFDLWWISTNFEFEGALLVRAVKATFDRRKTPLLESLPIGLSDEFAHDPVKRTQWSAFTKKIDRSESPRLDTVVVSIRTFAVPVLDAAASDALFNKQWRSGMWI